ncbi:hypothetical protein X975_08913, partial [Stegodyphus mimosarum]
MTKVGIGIFSIFFVVITCAVDAKKLICDDVDDLLFSGRHPSCRYREALRRAFMLDKSFQFVNDRDYRRQIEVWRALQNHPKTDPMKSKESPDSFNKKYEEDDLTSSKGNISSVTKTFVNNTVISVSPQSPNVQYLRKNESFVITDNINSDSKFSPEKNYSDKTFFASSASILHSTKLEIPKMLSSSSTMKEYNSSTSMESSSSISTRPTTYSIENVTVTLGSHINKTLSLINATAAQNNKEITSNASSSSVNISTENPGAVSVTNTEVTASDEAHTTSSSTYTESSSRGSNPASSNRVFKSPKPGESNTIAMEETTTYIAEEMSPTQKEHKKSISIKLIFLATFLIIATIALAIILTYMIRFKRNDMQDDEITLLP